MKTIVPLIAATLLTANASAVEIYQGLDKGNSDLSTARLRAEDFAGVQPGVGDSVERYQGLDEGNPDLFEAGQRAPNGSGKDPDIYMGIGDNPDLRF